MKFRYIRLTATVAAAALILTGCGENSSQSHSQSTQSSTKISKKSDSNKNKETNALWDSKKDEKLKDFINEWAPTMHQNYDKYNGKKSIETSTGFSYPDDFSKVTVEGTHDSIGYSKDGTGKYAYNVVAIYNYVGTQPPLPSHITYFFAFHNGKPVALVDQSRDGTPNLHETANTDVKNTFSEIAAGENESYSGNSSTTSNNSTTTNSKSESKSKSNSKEEPLIKDPVLIGYLLRVKVRYHGEITTDQGLGVMHNKNGYWMGIGTSASNTGYLIEGDKVIFLKQDFSGGQSAAEAPYMHIPYSIRDLQNEYYLTPAQKKQVDQIVQPMDSILEEDD